MDQLSTEVAVGEDGMIRAIDRGIDLLLALMAEVDQQGVGSERFVCEPKEAKRVVKYPVPS